MRVLVLCHRLPCPADTGGKMRMLHLVRQLAQRHEVAVLCPESSGPEVEGLRAALGPQVEVAFPLSPAIAGWRSVAAFLAPFPRDVHPAAAGSAAMNAVGGWVHRWSPDVLFAMDPSLGEYLRPYGSLIRVVDIPTDYRLYCRRRMSFAPAVARPLWWFRAFKWAAYMRRMGCAVDLSLLQNAVDGESLVRQLPEGARAVIVTNGIDLQEYTYDRDGPPHVAHCGALSYEPNLDGLRYFCREVWPLVRRGVPGARLIVTGDSTAAPKEVRGAPGVALTGHLPEVRSVLSACRAMVVPLRLGVGSRLKILEAMAVGTPIVSTTLGAEGLDVTDGRDILLADAPAAFADRVVQLMSSPDLRSRLSLAGRRLVEERYSWDHIGRTLHAVLDDVARQRAPGRGAVPLGGPSTAPHSAESR